MNLLAAIALFLCMLYLFNHIAEDPKFKPIIDKALRGIKEALAERKERKKNK